MSNSKKKAKIRQLKQNLVDHCEVSTSCEKYPGSKEQCDGCDSWTKGNYIPESKAWDKLKLSEEKLAG